MIPKNIPLFLQAQYAQSTASASSSGNPASGATVLPLKLSVGEITYTVLPPIHVTPGLKKATILNVLRGLQDIPACFNARA